MKARYLLFLLPTFLFAQEKNSIAEQYKKYFELPRESVFIHTNKTTYLVGEQIWLKTYIFDRKNGLSSKASSNIHVDLFNQKGDALIKSLVLNNKGVGLGQIALDTTLASGIYFLKATTNWMKNFPEDDSYVQKIEIINAKKDHRNSIKEDKYDIQFLPEGGNMVVGTQNSIGIKTIDQFGKGTQCSGVIKNSKGDVVANIKTNFLGIGKFSITPALGETNTAHIQINNFKNIIQALPQAKATGIALKVDNYRKDNVILSFATNKNSLSAVQGTYDLVIHKDGELSSIPIALQKTVTKIALPKKLLFTGINTVTLFTADKKPIVQRMFFNDYNYKEHRMNAINIKTEGDSTKYTMVSRSLGADEVLNASISVLPTGTKSYQQDHNIVSSFFLKPYIKGVVENPSYYFTRMNDKKKYNLDLLLLTQGWARYSWDNIFKGLPNPTFDFENGITFNGKLHSPLQKVTSLIMHPTEKNKSLFLVYDQRGKFHLKNFYPYINEEVYFTYFDQKGAMKKPIVSMSPIERNSAKFIRLSEYTNNGTFFSQNEGVTNIAVEPEYELLEEVKLKAKIKRDEILVNARVTDIGEEEIRMYPVITDFIQQSGFNVYYGDGVNTPVGQVYIYSRRPSTLSAPATVGSPLRDIRAQPDTFFSEENPEETIRIPTNEVPNFPSPTIFVDGAQLTDFSMLFNIPTKSIERIVVDKSGVGSGINGFGGVIKVFTRKGPIPSRKSNNYSNSFTYLVKYGFLKPEKFYTPRYNFRNKRAFERYGAISWHNDILISTDSGKQISVNTSAVDTLDFYIEGITNKGNFISQKLRIAPPKN